MNKVLSVVAEFNPFHNGHLYHVTESKKQTGCNYAIAIMNGNFTQRGEPSIVDKWSKAQMALCNGFDLVLELPTIYGISSAENFAEGAIKLANSLGIVDVLSFGSEEGNLSNLNSLASLFLDEPAEYVSLLRQELNQGFSFPAARERAVISYLDLKGDIRNILSSPNNILGIEYLKALKKFSSNIEPFTIPRIFSNYNSLEINRSFASSSAIRHLISSGCIEKLSSIMPVKSYSVLCSCLQNGNFVLSLSAYEKIILYSLRTMSLEAISNIPEVSEGLEIVLKNASDSCNTISMLLASCKSKRFTLTRLQRILLYILLGITKKDMEFSKTVIPYVRVLGMNSQGQKLISQICKSNPSLAVITSLKRFQNSNAHFPLQKMLSIDKRASDIYTLGFTNSISYANLDYTKKMIIL